jgi:hypothetical protein
MFSQNTISAYDLSGKDVVVICYDGDTARVATSVLRAKGITATSIKGGFRAFIAHLPHMQRGGQISSQQWSKTSNVTAQEIGTALLSPGLGSPREVLVSAP